jgi:hypothetical protein
MGVLIVAVADQTDWGRRMTKEEVVEKIRGLLKTEDDLSFLLQLKMEDLETLIARIRDRVDQVGR